MLLLRQVCRLYNLCGPVMCEINRFVYCETFEELDQMWSKPV